MKRKKDRPEDSSLGSIFIRKVHFRDPEMIPQIESKVVNRLRQGAAAIKRDRANQVRIIRSTAERVRAPAKNVVGKTIALFELKSYRGEAVAGRHLLRYNRGSRAILRACPGLEWATASPDA